MLSTHQAEMQFAKTMIVKIIGTGKTETLVK